MTTSLLIPTAQSNAEFGIRNVEWALSPTYNPNIFLRRSY